MKSDKPKNPDSVGISFRLPKEVAEKMYAIIDKSGKPSAYFVSYAVEYYIAHLWGSKLNDNDPYEIDKFTVKLLKQKG
jgi:predicted DNA-binding protein